MAAAWNAVRDQLVEDLKSRVWTTAELEPRIITLCQTHGFDTGGQPVDLVRMNAIGSLRSEGFIIPKVRGQYSITGFEEKKTLAHAAIWPAQQRAILNEWDQLPQPTMSSLRERLSQMGASEPIHGLSAGQIMGYELSRDEGRVAPDGSVLVRKFENYPRFRILLPGEEWRYWARKLQQVSVRPVQLVSHNRDREFKGAAELEQYEYKLEVVYGCRELLDIESRLNSRGRTTFRKNRREIQIHNFELPDYDSVFDLIKKWKAGPAGIKQRQLALGRDFVCLDLALTDPEVRKLTLVGYRGGHPVCTHIADVLPGNPTYAAQLVEKSLNYSSLPGGYNGTTNLNLFAAAEHYLSLGIEYIQGGAFAGGTQGLWEHKELLAHSKVSHYSYRWTATPPYEPEVIK